MSDEEAATLESIMDAKLREFGYLAEGGSAAGRTGSNPMIADRK
jgi:hypothetical protein